MQDGDLQQVEPWKLACVGARLAGGVAVSSLERVVACLPEQHGDVAYVLQFACDNEDRCTIDLDVSGTLNLRCEGCLQSGRHELVCSARLVVLKDGDDGERYREREPLWLSGHCLCLRHLVEDEVLLSLPMVFMHERAECSANVLLQRYSPKRTRHPLADLVQVSKHP